MINIALIITSLYLVYYDIRFKKVPNKIIIMMFLVVFFNKVYTDGELLSSLVSGLCAFFTFLLIYIVSKGKMGMGDTKYTSIIAFHFGYYFWLKSTIFCSLFALIISGFLILTKKINRKTQIPFIPFIFLGWFTNFIFEISKSYF